MTQRLIKHPSYLRDLEKKHGFPFVTFKIVNDVRIKQGMIYEHQRIDKEHGLIIVGRLGSRIYKCLDWYAKGEKADHIKYLYDTQSYDPEETWRVDGDGLLNWQSMVLATKMALGVSWKTFPIKFKMKPVVPDKLRHEYISTRAYFLWLEDKHYGIEGRTSDLDRWLQAEKYICERFTFAPALKLKLYA